MGTIGLVLGSGGARGVAHVGVLKALDDNGIKVDLITGSSMGSVVGGAYAIGMSPDEMLSEFVALKKMDLLDLSVNPLKNQALLKSVKLQKIIEKYFGETKFNELKIPFACVATDILTGKIVELKGNKKVAMGVVASSTIPGVFKPLKDGKKLLVDGGVMERLPINLAKKMGATTVIAVDVLGQTKTTPNHYTLVGVLGRVFDILDAKNTYQKLKTEKPDLLLVPDLGTRSPYSFKNHEEAYQAGYDVVMNNIDKIKAIIKKDKKIKR
ncbi:MAG: hypothetical protein E7342_00425 [Clostridiales bacterium]|nr:hypothetical protein [Clostridiales bacterium]